MLHSNLSGNQLHNPKGIHYAEDFLGYNGNWNSNRWKNSGIQWHPTISGATGRWIPKPSSASGAPGGGTVDTSGTPADNQYARFTDANTIEGVTYFSGTAISSASYIGGLNYPMDYIIYKLDDTGNKSGNRVYVKKGRNGFTTYYTDASTAIQYAINNIISGNIVFGGNHTYIISTQLDLDDKNHISIIGNGSLLKARAGNAQTILEIDDCDNITIDGINFDGNYINCTSTYPVSIKVRDSSNCINIQNCSFSNSFEGDIYLFDGTKDVNINNCSFYNWGFGTTAWSIFTVGGSKNFLNLNITQCSWERSGTALSSQPLYWDAISSNLKVHQCTFRNFGNRGIDIRYGSATITDSYFESGTTAITQYDGGYNQYSVIENCYSRKCNLARIVRGTSRIHNNICMDSDVGIYLGINLTGYTNSISNCSVENNYFSGANLAGIAIYSSQGGNLIRHNTIYGCGNYGIYSKGNSSFSIADDNIINNCGTNISNVDGKLISRLGINGSIYGTSISSQAISGGSYKNINMPANYIVWQDGATTYARNGRTGRIDFASTNASGTIQDAIGAVKSGAIYLNSDITLNGGISGHRYLLIEGNGHTIWPINTAGRHCIQIPKHMTFRNATIDLEKATFGPDYAAVLFYGKEEYITPWATSRGQTHVDNIFVKGSKLPESNQPCDGTGFWWLCDQTVDPEQCYCWSMITNCETYKCLYGYRFQISADGIAGNNYINANTVENCISCGDAHGYWLSGGNSFENAQISFNRFINCEYQTLATTSGAIYLGPCVRNTTADIYIWDVSDTYIKNPDIIKRIIYIHPSSLQNTIKTGRGLYMYSYLSNPSGAAGLKFTNTFLTNDGHSYGPMVFSMSSNNYIESNPPHDSTTGFSSNRGVSLADFPVIIEHNQTEAGKETGIAFVVQDSNYTPNYAWRSPHSVISNESVTTAGTSKLHFRVRKASSINMKFIPKPTMTIASGCVGINARNPTIHGLTVSGGIVTKQGYISSQAISGGRIRSHYISSNHISANALYGYTISCHTWKGPTVGGGGGLSNIVEDTTPQLGGDLDGNTHGINAVTYLSSQKISGGTIIGKFLYSYDYTIYRQGNTYYNRDKNGVIKRTFASPYGSGLKVVLDDAIDRLSTGGNIFIMPGNYKFTGQIAVDFDNIGIIGGGRDVTKLHSWSGSLYVLNVDKVRFKGFTLSGGTNIFLEYTSTNSPRLVENLEFENLLIAHISAQNIQSWNGMRLQGLNIYNGSNIIRNTKIKDCIFKNTISHGVSFNGDHGSSKSVFEHTLIEDCMAIRCGTENQTYDTADYDGPNWATGFLLCQGTDIIDTNVINCHASGCWESGFYMEGGPIVIGCNIVGCTARYCGVKKYENGDRLSEGQSHAAAQQRTGIGAHGNTKIINCTAIGNEKTNIKLEGGSGGTGVVSNCFIDGKIGGNNNKFSYYGILCTEDYATIEGNSIYNISSTCIKPSNYNRVKNNYIKVYDSYNLRTKSNTIPIDARAMTKISIEDNVIMGSGANYSSCYGIIWDNTYDITCRNNTIINTGYYGIYGGYRSIIEGNFISGSGHGHGILIANNRYENIIRNNKIYNPYYYGIYYMSVGRNDVIEGNFIYNTGMYGIRYFGNNSDIKNNTCMNTNYEGILVSGHQIYLQNNRCIDNRTSKSQDYGIAEQYNSNNNYIIGNYISGVSISQIRRSGSNTIIKGNLNVSSNLIYYKGGKPLANYQSLQGEIIRTSGNSANGTWVWMSVRDSSGNWEWVQIAVSG